MPALRGSRIVSPGFTLVELMVVLTVLGLVVLAIMGVIHGALRSKAATINQVESAQAARSGLELLARDLRSAGYGTDYGYAALPQPAIVYVDSMQVLLNSNQQPFPDTSAIRSAPLAYNPAGSPRPFPLEGTAYAPTKRFETGAELIRWTLDLDDDGTVSDADLDAADGQLARRTPNPNDLVLVRQVYGDSTGNVAGANGGLSERIALVSKPGNGVPPMFTVFMKGETTPWDWSSGPVPADKLADIERISVQITSAAPRKDSDGQFAQTTMRTEIAIDRNRPGLDTYYTIDGYVYNDLNLNRSKDTGEPGVGGALLMLGSTAGTHTDANGYYMFSVVAGNYKLKQIPPAGYGVLTDPDSVYVKVGPSKSVSFADTARKGGFVHVTVFSDPDNDGIRQEGDPAKPGVKVTAMPGPDVKTTDANGQALLFVPPGAYQVSVALPESLSATTPNPATGTMVQGATANVSFGTRPTPPGVIRGTVFRDVNRNGTYDMSETGIGDVWVGVTKDGGVTVSGSTYTGASGEYTLNVPMNDPPHTTPYTLYVVPPAGHFATSSTSIAPVWVAEGQVLTGKNFGVVGFQLIELQAARVMSVASGDLVEKDWPSTLTANRVKDTDLVLGSDANGNDQVSTWFNRYDSSTLLESSPDYSRAAAAGVLALVADTLDNATNLSRERADVVTGLTWNASKINFAVWITQSTSGNEGYLPSVPTRKYATNDKGDVTTILTADLVGDAVTPDGVDLLVGTASPTAGRGTIELWKNDNKNPPQWNRVDTYPPDGSIPINTFGAVTGMALADFDGDGLRDLVVTTRTIANTYSGQIMFFKNQGKRGNPVFLYKAHQTLDGEVPLSVAVTDIDSDSRPDVVVGTQWGEATGSLMYWRNTTPSTFSFTKLVHFDAPGIVTSLVAADFGGNAGKDLAIGFRTSTVGFGGGLRIYYTDAGTLLNNGVDPSGGTITNFVPAITTGNFNYGTYPAPPSSPSLTDLAAGIKKSASAGALVVVIR